MKSIGVDIEFLKSLEASLTHALQSSLGRKMAAVNQAEGRKGLDSIALADLQALRDIIKAGHE